MNERIDGAVGPVRHGIGLMSGSSCDGIDAALVRLVGSGPALQARCLAFETQPYPDALRKRLLAPPLDAHGLCGLNTELGQCFAGAAAAMQGRARTEFGVRADFVASHGHTLAHRPPGHGEPHPGSLQIGEAAWIAERCGIPVVSNFRPRDMAAGGQGAPLVPYGDWVLFRRPDAAVGCLNIGGIANITVVTPALAGVRAFDTGPGNMPIDAVVRHMTGGAQGYDAGGALASAGRVIEPLRSQLLAHPYFDMPPPKSTGWETFGAAAYLPQLAAWARAYRIEDLVATVTDVVATSIVQAMQRYATPPDGLSAIIVAGGGVHNAWLMGRLAAALAPLPVQPSDTVGCPADAREAVAFAILGHETLNGAPSNVPPATGAGRAVVLGHITPA